jgi:hypothetical protein
MIFTSSIIKISMKVVIVILIILLLLYNPTIIINIDALNNENVEHN